MSTTTSSSRRADDLRQLAPNQFEAERIVDGLAAFEAFAARLSRATFGSDRDPLLTGAAGRVSGRLEAAVGVMRDALIAAHVSGVLGNHDCHDLINTGRTQAALQLELRKQLEADTAETQGEAA